MQRYSGGLKVPNHATDKFTGETSTAAGEVTVTLTHPPKSKETVVVAQGFSGTSPRFYRIKTLTGNVLTVEVKKLSYLRANTPTDTGNSGGAGADPHSHVIGFTSLECASNYCPNEAQGTITVVYPIKG